MSSTAGSQLPLSSNLARSTGDLSPIVYLYDGSGVSEELDNSGNVLARYAFGPQTDEPLSELRSGSTSYYAQDAISSVTSLSNAGGTLANTYGYDSFGNLVASTGTIVNPYRYTGREFDVESSAYYYRARYYDQNAGHFMSEDPAAFFSGGIDFYSYALNSPANFNDPTGLEPCCQKNIDLGKRELERALNNSQIMGQGVFKKYKKCLLKLPEIKCDPNDKRCGYHRVLTPGVITISPLGALGRKGPCGPVASTLLHELVHYCYQNDLDNPNMLTDLQQEQEAWQAECQLFGYGCVCAQDPKKCGY